MPKILAVDDDAAALGALRQILAQTGYDVSTAASGERALEWLRWNTPDLIILDVAMPGLSGFDTCRRIRQDPRFRETPVIFLAARGLLSDMAAGQEAGSNLYLVKPLLASKLFHLLSTLLKSEPPLAPRPRAVGE